MGGNEEPKTMYSGKKKSETLKVEMNRKKTHYTKGKETRGPRNANWSSPRGAKALPYLTYIVILVGDKFLNKKNCTPDFFNNIKKCLQYKKFLIYVCKNQSY